MKSGRQRREEIKSKRAVRARIMKRVDYDPSLFPLPIGTLAADQDRLVHDNTWGPRPRYYVDTTFTCVDCNKSEVWTAAQQKWWYEVAQGKIASRANRCGDCRFKRRVRRSQDRRIHIEGWIAKVGMAETAARLKVSLDDLARMRARWSED
jgi:Probable zinc-ribbon domain